jgi:hypothetical protein
MPWVCQNCYSINHDALEACSSCGAMKPFVRHDPMPRHGRKYASGFEPPGYVQPKSRHHNFLRNSIFSHPAAGLPRRSRNTSRNVKQEPLFPPSWDQSQFPDNGAAASSSAAASNDASYHEENQNAYASSSAWQGAPSVQRHYPSFHPHPLNRVMLPPNSKYCDSCSQPITDLSSWRCANGCDVDLCSACDARGAHAPQAAAAAANQHVNNPENAEMAAAMEASRVSGQNNARRRAEREAEEREAADLAAATEASLANARRAAAASTQRYYPIFHPHPFNRVSFPSGSRICDACRQTITDPSNWKCADGCDVDLCDACDAQAIRADAAKPIPANVAAASAAAAAARAQQASAAAAASNEPGSAKHQANESAAAAPVNNEARRRANRETRARSAANRLAASARAAERNNAGQPGVPEAVPEAVPNNVEALRGAVPKHQNGFVPHPSPPLHRSEENRAAAAEKAERKATRLAAEAAAARKAEADARAAEAAAAEASAAERAAARMREDSRRQHANNSIKGARQQSRDLALERHRPEPHSVSSNYQYLLPFLNEFAGNIGGEVLMKLKELLREAAASQEQLTIEKLKALRKSVVLVSARFLGSELDRTHPNISNEQRGRLDAVFIRLNMMKEAIDARLQPERGGTRRRARHTKNKTGSKRRTHRH